MGEAEELTQGPVEAFAFIERYSSWTGRGWLEIRGPSTTWVRIKSNYASVRARLRQRFPDRPFTSEWTDGQFPGCPFGAPSHVVVALAYVAGAGVCGGAAILGGAMPGGLALVAVGWPLVRLLDSVQVAERGLRVGPPWASMVSWHDVRAVGVMPGVGGAVWVWAHTHRGGSQAPFPRVLVPALRARIKRLGHLKLLDAPPRTDHRYAIWREVAMALPWGVLVGMVVAAWGTSAPWRVLAVGSLVVAGLTLLGAAVEARATGWRTGAVIWLTLLYGLILTVLSLGSLILAS